MTRGMGLDRNRWLRLSPLLDELLDLEPALRAARMAELREQEPELAEELAALVDRADAVDREGFMTGPALPPPAAAGMAGQKVGAYTIERKLGQGGMGSVWLAHRHDGRFEGHVAIKFLASAGALAGSAERFAREGSILARLSHPNIARLIDAGVTGPEGAQRYLVLEYIDGEPIDRYCDAQGLDVTARVRLFLDVLAAVAHAHNRLILHRDIKPPNILVTHAGEVKLLDFGIAKLLDETSARGNETELTQQAGRPFTPAYAAPEQVEGGEVTTATDVYSLGVLLYLLLAGRHPTAPEAGTPLAQMQALVRTEPRRLSEAAARTHAGEPQAARAARLLRGDLDNIVAKALKKAPAERYANAERLADDLRRYLANEPVSARADAPAYLLAKFVRRHRAGVAAGTLVVTALAAGLGVALWQAHEARQQRVQAEGLIEFMLGDLRKKLQPVGRLDVLDAVGEKALAHYAAQRENELDADSLGRRARALHLIGEMAELRGHLDEASRVFRQAANSTAELMQREPNNAQRVFDHSQSVYWVGYVARRRNQLEEAEHAFGRYLELAQQLTRRDAASLDWRAELAYAHQNLGVVQLESARAAAALSSFEASRAAWIDIAPARPELTVELANIWGWVAKAHEALGRFEPAIVAQQAKVDVLRAMPDFERNSDVRQLLANAAYEIGRLRLDLGQCELAAESAQQALAQFDALTALDAANVDWSAQAALARMSLVEVQQALGRHDTARALLQPALIAAAGAKGKWHRVLQGHALALELGLARRTASLRPALAAQAEAFVADAAAAPALDAEQARLAGAVRVLLGDLLAASDRPAAEAHWRFAVQYLEPVVAQGDLPAMTWLAHAQLRLGDAPPARAWAQQLESTHYRHPAYAELRQRLEPAAGGGDGLNKPRRY